MPDLTHDVAIVGGGPAGLRLALLLADSHRVTVYDRFAPGGELLSLGTVVAPSGAPAQGPDLATELLEEAMERGVTIEFDEVGSIAAIDGGWNVTSDGGELAVGHLVLATGADHGPAPVPDTADLHGRGVSYCAGCDGPMYAGRAVAVLGDGQWAASDAASLAAHASRVVIIGGAAAASGDRIEVERSRPVALVLSPDQEVRGVEVEGGRTVEVDGVFVSVPGVPRSGLLADVARIDGDGRVVVDENLNAGHPGLYAVGDVRTGSPGSVAGAFDDAAAVAGAIRSAAGA